MPQTVTRAVNTRNPMWYFERNFSALMKMLAHVQMDKHSRARFYLAGAQVTLSLLEQTRYTLLLDIHQYIPGQDNTLLPAMHFTVRIYVDAQLAEVVSYQGYQRLRARYDYPNPHMLYRDEKRQANLLLHDWLSTCSRLNYRESITI